MNKISKTYTYIKEDVQDSDTNKKYFETVKTYTIFWVIITFIAIPVFLGGLVDFDMTQLKYNEIGDYFAGIAAPIAFLWLVMGYLQQSEELGINNRLLALQYDELGKTVSAQQDQVKHMEAQYDLLLREKYYPKFNFSDFDIDTDNNMISIKVENIGEIVYEVEANTLLDTMIVESILQVNGTNNKYEIVLLVVEEYEYLENIDIIMKIDFSLEMMIRKSICYKIKYGSDGLTYNLMNCSEDN